MEIRILNPVEQASIYPEVFDMLQQADHEFLPPLSARSSATQADLSSANPHSTGVTEYFEQLKAQRFIAAWAEGRLIGFVSYRENYTCAQISQTELPNIYISTLIVRPEARGRGVTTELYSVLFAAYESRNIFTRTWSSNLAHIKILERFGFSVAAVLENHRGPGIHTLYFKKPLSRSI